MRIEEQAAPSITIGLPVHSGMPYLPEAIEGLLRQTYTEFQVLVILDGSSDASADYLASVHDPRLRVVEQQHCGLTFTLNRMLRECETDWLVRQDADDISAPNRLRRLVQAMTQFPDAGMFYSLAAYHPRGKSLGLYRSTRGTPDDIRAIARSGYVPAICHPSVALHVQRTLQVGGYRPGIQCEDADLWWRMALASDIRFIPEVLLLFRQNFASLTSRNLEQQALHGLYVQYLLLSQLHSRSPAPLSSIEQELSELLRRVPLRAKQELRHSNIALGEQKLLVGMGHFLQALLDSPSYVLGRLRDELFPPKQIRNGLRPEYFLDRKDSLWPATLPGAE